MLIYVSSTSVDLKEHRANVLQALRAAGHDFLPREEDAGADPPPVEKRLGDLDRCDVYVGLFAWHYGFTPPGHTQSVTELEYRKAQQKGIPTLVFLLDEEAPWPPQHIDGGAPGERAIDRLREELKRQVGTQFFRTPEELTGLCLAALNGQDTSVSPPPPGPSAEGAELGRELAGRNRILRELGRGGMGAVYLAHNATLDRQVAIKIPRFGPDDRPEMQARFLREARAPATLRHPNI